MDTIHIDEANSTVFLCNNSCNLDLSNIKTFNGIISKNNKSLMFDTNDNYITYSDIGHSPTKYILSELKFINHNNKLYSLFNFKNNKSNIGLKIPMIKSDTNPNINLNNLTQFYNSPKSNQTMSINNIMPTNKSFFTTVVDDNNLLFQFKNPLNYSTILNIDHTNTQNPKSLVYYNEDIEKFPKEVCTTVAEANKEDFTIKEDVTKYKSLINIIYLIIYLLLYLFIYKNNSSNISIYDFLKQRYENNESKEYILLIVLLILRIFLPINGDMSLIYYIINIITGYMLFGLNNKYLYLLFIIIPYNLTLITKNIIFSIIIFILLVGLIIFNFKIFNLDNLNLLIIDYQFIIYILLILFILFNNNLYVYYSFISFIISFGVIYIIKYFYTKKIVK